MRYRVTLPSDVQEQIRRLNPLVRRDIRRALQLLEVDPRGGHARELRRPLVGWRVPVGHWRVLYRIDDDQHLVFIDRIGPRADVYRDPQA